MWSLTGACKIKFLRANRQHKFVFKHVNSSRLLDVSWLNSPNKKALEKGVNFFFTQEHSHVYQPWINFPFITKTSLYFLCKALLIAFLDIDLIYLRSIKKRCGRVTLLLTMRIPKSRSMRCETILCIDHKLQTFNKFEYVINYRTFDKFVSIRG